MSRTSGRIATTGIGWRNATTKRVERNATSLSPSTIPSGTAIATPMPKPTTVLSSVRAKAVQNPLVPSWETSALITVVSGGDDDAPDKPRRGAPPPTPAGGGAAPPPPPGRAPPPPAPPGGPGGGA